MNDTSAVFELIHRFEGYVVYAVWHEVREANEELMTFLLAAPGPRSDAHVPPGDRLAVWALGGICAGLAKTIGDFNEEQWPFFHESMILCEYAERRQMEFLGHEHYPRIRSFDEEHWSVFAMYKGTIDALREEHDPQLSWLTCLDEEQRSLSWISSLDEEQRSTSPDEELLGAERDERFAMYEGAHGALCEEHNPQLFAMYDDEQRSTSPDEEVLEAERNAKSMNIEALCAAPPEALTHSPSRMPLSFPGAFARKFSAFGAARLRRRAHSRVSAPSPTPTRAEEHIASAPSPAAAT